MSRHLSYAEASDYLRIKRGTLRAMVFNKQIPHIRISPRIVIFEVDKLDAWLRKRAND